MISPSLRRLTVPLELIIPRTDLVMYCRVSFTSFVPCFLYFLSGLLQRLEITGIVYGESGPNCQRYFPLFGYLARSRYLRSTFYVDS